MAQQSQMCYGGRVLLQYQGLTSSAELHSLTPARHQVLPIALLHRCLHSHTVFCTGTQEPVASHCHGQRHCLGHELGGDILRSGVQMENQASVLKSHPILALFQNPHSPKGSLLFLPRRNRVSETPQFCGPVTISPKQQAVA